MEDDTQRKQDQLARMLDLQLPKNTKVFKNISSKKLKELITQIDPQRVALDIASKVYQVYFVDYDTIYNFSVKMKNVDDLLNSLSKGTIVAFESCGSSMHLGRYCKQLGLEPHILSAVLVKGVRGSEDKSDSADAAAIYRTDMAIENEPDGRKKLGIIKTEEEQGLSGILARREDVMTEKVAQEHRIFALAREYGYDFARSIDLSAESYIKSIILSDKGIKKYIDDAVSSLSDGVYRTRSGKTGCEKVSDEKRELVEKAIFEQPLANIIPYGLSNKAMLCYIAYRDYLITVKLLKEYNNLINHLSEEDERCKRLKEIPGVGPVSAVTLVSNLGPAMGVLESPGAAAKYIGVVPAHTGTGGKTFFLGMSKQGIPIAKRILFQAGMSVVCSHTKKAKSGFTSWVIGLITRGKNKRLVAGAIANKIVRMAFALLRDQSHYHADLDVHFVCHAP